MILVLLFLKLFVRNLDEQIFSFARIQLFNSIKYILSKLFWNEVIDFYTYTDI